MLICLITSLSALAQSKDSSKFVIIDARPIDQHEKPLIIMDGKVYKGNMKNIDANEISSIDVLKDSSATALYGKKAANGVIIIKTKKYKRIDTTQKTKLIDSIALVNAQYVVDGQLSDNKAKNVDPNTIVSVTVLKERSETYISHDSPTVIIITKPYAIKEYQKKFSAFSKKYKDYLTGHKNQDDSCSYVLNGTFLINESNEKIKKLYIIKSQQITGIGITENPWYNGGESRKYLVLITTKK
jgi:TonB-dependent SusC/RagA subfamily outer membrane receptor